MIKYIFLISISLILLISVSAAQFTDITLQEFKPWTEYSNEQKDSLRDRWSAETVDQVVEAIQNSQPLPRFVNRLQLTKEEYIKKENLKDFGFEIDETFDYLRYDLRGITLENRDLKYAGLVYVHLEGARLISCNLAGANLEESHLQNIIIADCDLSEIFLTGANMEHSTLDSVNLLCGSLENVNLKNSFVVNCNLEKANLSEANLENSSMEESSFIETSLYNANLKNASLARANLYKASLVGTILQSADFEETRLDSTFLWNTKLGQVDNLRYIVWGDEFASRYVIGEEQYLITEEDYRNVELIYLELKTLYSKELMTETAKKFHYRENEVRTARMLITNRPFGYMRLLFLKWPYGYGSRPEWLMIYSASVILIFAMFYALQTITAKNFKWSSSGLSATQYSGVIREDLLPWNRGKLLLDCLYFSILSFATFGYGAVKPRQWLELFRFKHVEFRPVRWSRIFVGIEAAVGIYVFALLVVELFGKRYLN